ncbi:UDP-glucose 4-epimerase GalE, partial [Prochlorococcus sp. AH-716-D13]|nr:UDP-glucose 4-epimerase GalE [Prochlorococcus sp. AH-716-D13]
MKNILLTGGLGYIGSHTASVLSEKNLKFFILDNLTNCRFEIIKSLEEITNQKISFLKADIRDTKKLIEIIESNKISSVIHFAALKSVEDSINDPIKYYEVNIGGTISLLNAMKITGVREILFSSSATVYGDPKYLPIDERHITNAINPYGNSKLIVEKILLELANLDKNWSIASLRYFNPIGAHPSTLIGEAPITTKSKNLMPNILNSIKNPNSKIKIFGKDYDTPDGTGIRDYIHIMDLANAHLKALEFITKSKGFHVFNIGTGKGYSVLELINTFENISGLKVPRNFVGRRDGDISECYADPSKANNVLGWYSEFDLIDMCLSSWEFSKK